MHLQNTLQHGRVHVSEPPVIAIVDDDASIREALQSLLRLVPVCKAPPDASGLVPAGAGWREQSAEELFFRCSWNPFSFLWV